MNDEKIFCEKLLKISKRETSIAKQKSCFQWLKEGYNNTRYFFKRVNVKDIETKLIYC